MNDAQKEMVYLYLGFLQSSWHYDVSQFENLGIVRELWKIRQDSVAGLLLL